MRNNKAQTFSTKFSNLLSKLKDTSTIQIAHQQIRGLFNEFTLKQLITPFLFKMDNSDNLSQRQRKEYAKIYISLIQNFKQQILSEQYYDRIIDSLNKKNQGVGDVVGYICKSLINRYVASEQIQIYIQQMINCFRNNQEISKILKQIIESIDCNIIANMQTQIITLLHDKIAVSKTKAQYLQTMLSLVHALEDRLVSQNQINQILVKYLKSDDWNCRKICVDTSYSFLVINNQINQQLHAIIKQLKYDKIKHVRDAVCNYEMLYRQIYGQQTVIKPKIVSNNYIRENKVKSTYSNHKIHKSPGPISKKEPQKQLSDHSHSLDRSIKGKPKNQNFFKNAKDSDVIKINEDKTFYEKKNNDQELNSIEINQSIFSVEGKFSSNHEKQKKNFQAYLKNRNSPKVKALSPTYYSKKQSIKNSEIKRIDSHAATQKEKKQKNENQADLFKKKQNQNIKNQYSSSKYLEESKDYASITESELDKINQEFSISYIELKKEISQFEEFKHFLKQFESKVNQRFDQLEKRIQELQKRKGQPESSTPKSIVSKNISNQNLEDSRLCIDSPSVRSQFYNETPNESKWDQYESIESNLEGKIKNCIQNENWNEAYAIALANNKKSLLLDLMENCIIPQDQTVEQCLLLEIRKLLDNQCTLKWLKYYLLQKQLPRNKIQKFKQQLQKKKPSNNKNYELMKKLLLNELNDRLQNS